MAAPDAEGWQVLEVAPPEGMTEKQGKLFLEGGGHVDLQVSLAESITTLASTVLPGGWTYENVMAMDERLESTALRARVGVVGLREGARVLRLFDLAEGRQPGEFQFIPRQATSLPPIDPTSPHRLRRLQVGRATKGYAGRRSLFVRLARERALLIDPYAGALRERHAEGLFFTGASATSGLKQDRLFTVRRDRRNGARYLRRWWVRGTGSEVRLRGRLFEEPLQERLGVSDLRAFDMRSWRKDAEGFELESRESLLLLASATPTTKARARVVLFELQPRRDGSGTFSLARRRYVSSLVPRAERGLPTLRRHRTPTIGSNGYPRRFQIGVPDLRAGEIVGLDGVDSRFTGRAYVEGVSHQIISDGFSVDPVFFLQAEYDGEATQMRRRVLTRDGLATRVRGRVVGRRFRQLTTSARGRHSYALSVDGPGGVEARYSLRLMTNGLPPGTNLPPRVDAGPDLTVDSPNGSTATVRLRAGLFDANGDPLAVRWSAPGVRFDNPNARETRAVFPGGTTQVRIRARETGGKVVWYEGSDVLDVTVNVPSGVDDTPGLSTVIKGIFPNPANPRVSIAYTVEKRGHVGIRVFDMSGKMIRELVNDVRNAGAYDVQWDGTDQQGRPVSSGIYPVQLVSGGGVDTRNAVIVR